MPDSYEKSVKGGTKIKLAPPKSKYVEHILQATHAGDAGVAEIFRTMTNRLRDSTWTIVFKALIIVHLMIREGEPDVTLRYIADHPTKLAISSFNDAQEQGRNIRHYYTYIIMRAKAYRDTKTDWVKKGHGRLKRLTVDKGLLRETEIVQKQLKDLLKCDLLSDPENEISLTAFRLLTMDLLELYAVMNEGTINVLEHYFEMSHVDAEKSLEIYRTFAKQTNDVVEYLQTARMYEGATRLEIPKLKHAPTGLTQSLADYLKDPDFEVNRRQYLAQQEAKRTGKPVKEIERPSANGSSNAPQQPAPSKGPAPDLIDLFGSLDANQQPMASQPGPMFAPQQQPFQTGFVQQSPSTNPFAPLVQQQTAQPGAGNAYNPFAPQVQPQPQAQQVFGGQQFQPTPQPQQQQQFQPAQQPQQQPFQTGTNPFGQPQSQSQMQPMQTGNPAFSTGFPQQQGSFQPQSPQQAGQAFFGQVASQQNNSPFGQPQPQLQQQQQQQQQMPQNGMQQLQPQQTSSNPFRQSMMPQATGAASPFTQQSTPPVPSNPFGMNMGQGMPTIQESSSPFGQQQQQQQQSSFFTGQQQSTSPFQSAPPAQPLQPTKTGTNPFARTTSPGQSLSPLSAQPTGSTNPFRQSQFVNQQTGQAWQNVQQGTIGGMDVNAFQSTPIFPRPPGQ